MKKCFMLLLSMSFMASAYASWDGFNSEKWDEATADALKKSSVTINGSESDTVKADECYVLFLIEATGDTMQAAKVNFDKKLQDFSATVKKDFPQASEKVIAVNFGTRDFSDYQGITNPFTPNITKILIFILPPDEEMAVKLLDCGLKARLTPFCGRSRVGSAFGAIFFGIKNPGAEFERLYKQGVRNLSVQAEKLANETGRRIAGIVSLEKNSWNEKTYTVEFKNIEIELPSAFCSTSKDMITISLDLTAEFLTQGKKADEQH